MTILPRRLFYGWVMVGGALVINLVSATLNPVIFSFFIGPMSEELGVSTSALSWSLTLRLATAGLAGPLLGVLLDRHGARWLGAACGLLAGGTMVALSFAHELWLVYALFALTGFAGFGGPAGQLLTQVPLSKWFVLKRGRALAIATTGMAAGTTLAIPTTQALIEALGWRETYAIFGIVIAGAIALTSVLVVRRVPEDMGLYPDGASRPPVLVANSATGVTTTTEEEWSVRQALGSRTMWLLLGALALAGMALTGTLVHRVHFWHELGMSPTLVGLGTALDPFTVVFSVFAFGILADRVPVRYLGFIGLAGLALSIVPMIISSGEPYTILAHNFIWGVSAGGYITLNNLVWPNYFGRESVGAIRGVTLPVSIAASGIGAPLYGYLLDSGLNPAYVWGASLVAFGLGAVLVLFAKAPRLPVRAPDQPQPLPVLGVAGK
ncbi:MAG: MFS transporter [Dehalococcoidia bacterium]|nr:MFS transporter [Dehalococcoidia bacterium]